MLYVRGLLPWSLSQKPCLAPRPFRDIFTSSNNNSGHMPVYAFLIRSDVEGKELVLV